MSNGDIEQSDFGAGIYRGREAPAGAVFDAVNALIDDEGQAFERGKTAYLTTSDAGETLLGLGIGYFPAVAANRVLAWNTALHLVSGSGWLTLAIAGAYPAINQPVPGCRMSAINGAVVWPSKNAQAVASVYGGSLKTSFTAAGTLTVTNGSKTVTGVGTSWLTTVDPGMLLAPTSNAGLAAPVVEKVNSNTSLTLLYPWTGATAAGSSFVIFPIEGLISAEAAMQAAGVPFSALGQPVTTPTYVASVARRLLIANANVVAFSEIDGPMSIPSTNFHVMPIDAFILGLDGIGDVAQVFTTRGIYFIENLLYDPVDDAGNIQQQVRLVNKDVVLWGDPGIAAFEGGLVVPAIDDVYILDASGETQPVSEGIRPLYRSYVKAGYQPGLATVHRGHYKLPVMNGSTVVDTLVCRLDRPFQTPSGRVFRPWTRWAGHAMGPGYAVQLGASTRSPKLFGINGQRVTDLTDCMTTGGSATQDADSTTPTFTVDTNDFDLSPGLFPSQAGMARVVYETTGGTPTPTMASAVGPESASFTAATLLKGGGASDGTDYSAYRVNRRAERIRLRFQNASQVTSLILRRITLAVRQSGR